VQAGICDVCHAFTGNVSRVTQRCRGAYARAWFGLSLVPIKQGCGAPGFSRAARGFSSCDLVCRSPVPTKLVMTGLVPGMTKHKLPLRESMPVIALEFRRYRSPASFRPPTEA
jgi:hypothetical protein